MAVRTALIWMVLLAGPLAATGCSRDDPTGPSPLPVLVSIPDPVEARGDVCATCADPAVTVAEFAVTITDPFRRGGTVVAVETLVENRSRRSEIGRNTRPNASAGYPDVTVPRETALVLPAGIVFPLPPPRDEITITVMVRLSDGREGSATSRVFVRF
jgi:hypothetical protein